MITKEEFDEVPAGEVFADGNIKNNPDGYFVSRDSYVDRDLLWLAQKGFNNDWCIYYGLVEYQEGDELGIATGRSMILSNGDKVCAKDAITKMLPCSEDVLKLYRY